MSVYLDHAATTPMLPEAMQAYADAMGIVGNASSIHSGGQRAKRSLEESRETIAASVGCDPIEIVFTSGGTESINLALKGLFWSRNEKASRPRVVAPEGEHHATMDSLEWLVRYERAEIDWVGLDQNGFVDLDGFERASARQPDSVSLATALWANNEVGTIEPVEAMSTIAHSYRIPLHIDAVSAYGHIPIDFEGIRQATGSAAAGLVAMSISAHKVGGPVGIGALILSRAAQVVPLHHGGGQQRNVRSGTQDVAAAAAFAVAAARATEVLAAENRRLAILRDKLVAGVLGAIPSARLSGSEPGPQRLASNAHFIFPGTQGDSLLFLLDSAGVEVSTGSACQAGVPEPSHVLVAMGRSDEDARAALRVTLGRTTTETDVDALLSALPEAHARASRAGLASRQPQLGR